MQTKIVKLSDSDIAACPTQSLAPGHWIDGHGPHCPVCRQALVIIDKVYRCENEDCVWSVKNNLTFSNE